MAWAIKATSEVTHELVTYVSSHSQFQGDPRESQRQLSQGFWGQIFSDKSRSCLYQAELIKGQVTKKNNFMRPRKIVLKVSIFITKPQTDLQDQISGKDEIKPGLLFIV